MNWPLISSVTRKTAAIFDQMKTLKRKIQNLRRTRDLLLPRLLLGQVKVKET